MVELDYSPRIGLEYIHMQLDSASILKHDVNLVSEKAVATVEQFEIIGETANKITAETRSLAPQMEWSKIIGLRNILVHDYYIIDHSIVWEFIKDELLKLKSQIRDVIEII